MTAAESHTHYKVLVETATALMSEEHDLPGLLELILAKVKELFGVDRCAILRVDEASHRLRIFKSVGYAPHVAAGYSICLGEGISGWVASSGIPAFVEDVSADPRYIQGVEGGVSEIAVPLKHAGDIIGVLDIESKTRLVRADFHMDLLTIFASQCANAIHNASLVGKLKQHKSQLEARLRELQVLNHVGKLMGETLSLDELLGQILRLAQDVFHFTSCAVLLPEKEDSDCLRIVAAVGYPADVVSSARIRRGQGITGEVFRTGIPRLIDDVTLVPDYIPGIVGGRCEMACPLMSRGRTLGVLDAEGAEPACFSEQQFVLFSIFASQAAVAVRNAQMLERTQITYYQTISSLASALEARDSYTRGHSERVTNISLAVASRLGLGARDLDVIRQAGILHDIGKIGVPDDILKKESSLSSEDRHKIEDHPQYGNTILSQLRFLREASRAIIAHHERFDGKGYPAGLAGSDIPIVARILAVADSYDAMTSDRPYRQALSKHLAREELIANSGLQFDPDVVRAFLSVIDEVAGQ
jgi:putative nucleotidyltransferase with HDIG domain